MNREEEQPLYVLPRINVLLVLQIHIGNVHTCMCNASILICDGDEYSGLECPSK